MGAGGEPEDADTGRVEIPLPGMKADEAQGALRVLQRQKVLVVTRACRHTVFQQHTRDADGIEPLADFGAFEVHRENGVAAAGAHDHGRASVLLLGRAMEGNGRLADVAQADHPLPGHQAAVWFCRVMLFANFAFFVRSALRPKGNRSRNRGAQGKRAGADRHQERKKARSKSLIHGARSNRSPDSFTGSPTESVAQTSSLLYRGFPIRWPSLRPECQNRRAGCRLEVGDTAGWKPALRSLGRLMTFLGY